MGECLREKFSLWRYPNYVGELKHVDQSFIIQARERRTMPQTRRY